MIVGLGIGFVDVPRFEALEERHRTRMHRKLFTEGECAYAARRARGHESLAVRLAAKTAALRALGMSSGRWHDFEVTRKRGRPPVMNFHGQAARAAEALGVTDIALTLTHDALCCVGQVVLESRGAAALGADR
jgi:holo-[acyl-carrier protein] synthase